MSEIPTPNQSELEAQAAMPETTYQRFNATLERLLTSLDFIPPEELTDAAATIMDALQDDAEQNRVFYKKAGRNTRRYQKQQPNKQAIMKKLRSA